VSNVLPFRRRKTADLPEAGEPSRCPECGWKMPAEVQADRESVKKELVVHFHCPECGVPLFWMIHFDVE